MEGIFAILLLLLAYAPTVHLTLLLLLSGIALTILLRRRPHPLGVKICLWVGLSIAALSVLISVLHSLGILFYANGKTLYNLMPFAIFIADLFFATGFAILLFSGKKTIGDRIFAVVLTVILLLFAGLLLLLSTIHPYSAKCTALTSPGKERTIVVQRTDNVSTYGRSEGNAYFYNFYRQIAPGVWVRIGRIASDSSNITDHVVTHWEDDTVTFTLPNYRRPLFTYEFEE
ncbi:MAG: hypothetical protein IJW98_04000 [Clostridia bacterium]|nr:hypothetical protein [Clostridia bacterium]